MGPLVLCAALAFLQVNHVFGAKNVPDITDIGFLDSVYILEDAYEVGDVLGTVKAHDPDGTAVQFFIFGDGFRYFSINRTSGEVTLKSRLDFEVKREIVVSIRVTDEDLQTSLKVGKVFVKDSNDNEPEFASYDHFETLNEDDPVGTVIANISASDLDTNNAILTMACMRDNELLADACDTFSLVGIPSDISNKGWAGQLVLSKSLDYETRISYAIILEAFDGKYKETNEIHIEVNDINDSPPIWTEVKPVVINEEESIGTYITTVTARDGDVNKPRSIFYEIIDGDEFRINNRTGVISNDIRLDFDALDHKKNVPYEVRLRAREVISENPLVVGTDLFSTSTAVVSITVSDIDDNTPSFDRTQYTAFIPENIVTEANIPGLQMTITDIDSGVFNSFDLVTLNFQDIFAIIPSSGESNAGATLIVLNSEKIDFETIPNEYVIKVEARENKVTPALTGTTTVTIKVTDVNDQSPEFTHETFYENLSETSSPTTSVITLQATDSEAGAFGTAGIRYTLYGNQQNHFVIDQLTGTITVGPCNPPNKPGTFPCIDYERKKRYVLTVSATDNLGDVNEGRTKSVQVIVTILDENDNVPKPAPRYTAYIIEGQMIPQQPLIVKAEDPDTVGGPVFYKLSGDAEIISNWKITNQDDSLGDRVGEITATRPILFSDAQDPATGSLSFQVISSDIRDPVTSQVTIFIIDINNNIPEFSVPVYEVDIMEDTLGGIFVTTVSATDGDAPTTGNGLVDFSIVSGAQGKFTVRNPSKVRDTFVTDIYTTSDATFNFDVKKKFEMTLQARDQGTPESKKGTALLIVNIIDINNNDPRITPTSVSIAVPEEKSKNANVHQVIAIDPDKNNNLRYYMRPTRAYSPNGGVVDKNVYDYEQLFRIEELTGIVRVNNRLNRELTSFIVNQLEVVDTAANPPQTGTGALFITITEVNDQDPEFVLPHYNITIDEELNINFFVHNLLCTDEDDKIASYQLFQTEPRNPNYFALMDNTGALIVSDRIDYEKLEEIKLMSICYDDGVPRRSGSTEITITIRNINDNSPEFSRPLYTAQLSETAQGVDMGGYLITTVHATDIDKDDFGLVRYKIADVNSKFEVDEFNGTVTVKSGTTFDREVSSSFGFQVVAYDSPNTPSKRRETTVPIYLTILDINDNCPVFSAVIYDGSIPESAKTGTDVIDILASDKDYGNNKVLAFTVQADSFDPPEGSIYFGVGRKSGRIFTRNTLSGKSGLYRFNVTATDTDGMGPDSCSTHVPVEVTVSQSQNYAPVWLRPPKRDFVIYILESQYEGMLVYHSKAEDLDPGPSGVVDYYFIDGNSHVPATEEFRINQVTGVIRAEIEFDREQVDTYFLTLVAKDQGATHAMSEITMIVVIMDVDDNDPIFETENGVVSPLVLPEFDLKEGVIPPNGGYLGSCNATDADSDHDNNRIFFELLSGDSLVRDMVRIDRDTCDIFLTKAIDYEVMHELHFSIYAFNERNDDSVKRYKREANPSILPVTIRVTDVNDNPPKFIQSKYFACAALESPFRSSIVDLDAHDVEQQDVELQYTLEGTNSFTIDKSGVVHNTVSFASTADRVFGFNAKVEDGASFDVANVNVFVTTESNQIVLKVNRPSSDVLRIQKTYEEHLVKSHDDIKHACVTIKSHITDEGKISSSESDVYVAVAVKDRTTGKYVMWSESELYDHITLDRSANRQMYHDDLFVTGVTESDDHKFGLDEDVVLAILIIAILLIVIAILLFILACYCIWAKKKKKVKKIKAQRHTIVQAVPDQSESFENPVYHNSGYVAYEDEYSTVSKTRRDVGPIAPVVIPAPENLQPLSSFAPVDPEPEEDTTPPEIPEPVIETEVMASEEPESAPAFMEPEYEDQIETVVEDDDQEDLPLPDPPVDEDGIEIETEIRADTPPPAPEPSDD